jgi:hemerythrin
MVFFEWDPSLETGEPEIDLQHKGLFALANELQTCVDAGGDQTEAVTDTVYRLADYVVQHFHDEEALMLRCGYPGMTAHHRLHQNLTEETMRVASRFFNGEDLLPTDLAAFLNTWLREHIREEDMRLVRYVRKHAAAAAPGA